jgi:amino acid adenylation domain-containing protein
MLAVGKAGGAFMLAEPTAPPERLRVMLAESRVGVVLTDAPSAARLAALDLPVELVVVGDPGSDPRPPVTGVGPGNTAYVVFTSGTTGRPKAIAISHEAVVNLHLAQRRVFGIRPDDRVLQFLSPNFDGCVFDVTMALLCGAVLVTVPAVELTVGPPLLRTLRDRAVSVVTLTPSVWAVLPRDPRPRLRVAAAAGERLPATVVRQWSATGRRFLNLYGPAETAVWATWHECDPAAADPPIGRPVPNKRVYVLDDLLRPVPVGEAGQLWVGGLGVGRYLGRPDLMEDRFRPDPFADVPGHLLYGTGDICRWQPDGTLEYLGRRDRQAKIRGQRVELDEVERVLLGAPGVLLCSVVERDGHLEARVVAAHADEAVLRAHLADRLHTGMVPARFTFVADLPRTPGGKTSHEPLAAPVPAPVLRPPASTPAPPAPPPVLPSPPAHPVPPAWPAAVSPAAVPASGVASAGSASGTDGGDLFVRLSMLTWRVAQFFAASLQLPQHQVKVNSDFFTLGGDSLANAELLASIETEVGVLLDVEELLSEPTPAGIASYLAGRGPKETP